MSVFETQEQSNNTNSDGSPASTPAAQGNNGQGNEGASMFADQLSQIQAPDGRQKYADVQTALASIPHAQSTIDELKSQVAALTEQNAKMKGFEDVVAHLNTQGNVSSPDTPSNESITPEQLSSLIDSQLNQRTQAELAAANEMAVTDKLVAKYGDKEKAFAQLQAKAQQLGMSVSDMQGLSQRSPAAVLAYFEQAAPASSGQPLGFGGAPASDAPQGDADVNATAIANLFGKTDPLINKWKAAAN